MSRGAAVFQGNFSVPVCLHQIQALRLEKLLYLVFTGQVFVAFTPLVTARLWRRKLTVAGGDEMLVPVAFWDVLMATG